MNSGIPQYSLSKVTHNNDCMFHMLELQGEVERMPAIFLEPHRKDYHVLMLVKQGSSRHWVDMIPYTFQSNTLYFSTPNQLHLQEEPHPLYGKILSFTRDFLLLESDLSLLQFPIIINPIDAHELPLNPQQTGYIDMLMADLLTEYQDRNEWRESMLHTKLKVLLIYLSRLYVEALRNADTGRDRMLLHQYRGLINQHYAQIHDVTSYAGKLNISPGHLGKIVRQQTGKSAIEHIHERLVLEAKRILFHTEQTMKEIAFELGFEDASYFNRFFKKQTNKTPLVYRKETRQMFK
jgi:AraC family transcriptional activator of pobA